MGGKRAPGFTIIETMLFLAVSGVLAIGIITSASYAINVQRYRDATVSLVSYLQSQYDRVINVQNDRSDSLMCTPAGKIQQNASGTKMVAGTSDCTIVGMLLRATDTGGFLSLPVFASGEAQRGDTDIVALEKAQLFTDPEQMPGSRYAFEWGATMQAKLGTGDINVPFSILIVRSPSSGTVRTFVGRSASDTPASLVTVGVENDLKVCLDPNSFYGGGRTGAIIYAGAANASAVKQAKESEC